MSDVVRLFSLLENIDNDPLEEIERCIFIEDRIPRRNIRDVNPFQDFSDNFFKKRFRFSKSVVVNNILPRIYDRLRVDIWRGLPIKPEIQLTTALRYYATGSFQIVCGDTMHISQSTVCHIVKRVSRALALLLNTTIKFPSNLMKTKDDFEKLGSTGRSPELKNVIGTIDCTHIKILKPRGVIHTEQYRNRKGFSLNVQVVGGPNLKIYDIVARCAGSTHDSRILKNSRINLRLLNKDLDGVLVGDSGYPCTRYLLTPILNLRTTAEEGYNKCQIKTRNLIERLFGIWTRRFPCLQKGLATKLETTANIIVACAVLHNIAVDTNEYIEFNEDGNRIEAAFENQTPNDGTIDGMVLRANIVARDFS